MKIFNLPDLGEGLPDAEIIEWYISAGNDIKLDEPLVSMETAKAVVDVPSPYTGEVTRLFGQPGDIITTGSPLAGFAIDDDAADGQETADTGTVVGSMETSDQVVRENLVAVSGVKVTPGLRALARKLKVNLASLSPSGKGGVVTRKDIEDAASESPQIPTAATDSSALAAPATGAWEPVRGTRRTMARVMSESHAQVVPTSIMDDADIHLWADGQDMTVRLLRSLWAGAQAEPGLNAWYDAAGNRRVIHKGMDVGMAVDTPDGLFAAALRNVHTSSAADIRNALTRLKQNIASRSIPPEDLKDYTIMLSNFGMFAGRYATPVITPPCVSIIAAGKARDEVVPAPQGFEVHRIVPLSLTFDHRACTGGEAARFLKAMIDDLGLPRSEI